MNDRIKFLLKKTIRVFNRLYCLFDPIFLAFGSLHKAVYSDRYCLRFRCRNCLFQRPVNFVLGEKYFEIGENVVFGKYAVLTAWDHYNKDVFNPYVKIGDNCNFGDYLHLTAVRSVVVGTGVLTGRWVTITDNAHGTTVEISEGLPPEKRDIYSKGGVVIEDNVWIGDKATILPGVTIGRNSIIGANSVVTKSIPANSVATGNPAVVIKTIA